MKGTVEEKEQMQRIIESLISVCHWSGIVIDAALWKCFLYFYWVTDNYSDNYTGNWRYSFATTEIRQTCGVWNWQRPSIQYPPWIVYYGIGCCWLLLVISLGLSLLCLCFWMYVHPNVPVSFQALWDKDRVSTLDTAIARVRISVDSPLPIRFSSCDVKFSDAAYNKYVLFSMRNNIQ